MLKPGGHLIVYDFAGGRHMAGDHRLNEWFALFESRYPSPPDYALDVKILDYPRFGLRLEAYQEIEVPVPMSFDAYLSYVLSEIRVESAIARGEPATEIQNWCRHTLRDIFGDTPRDISFNAYAAYARRESSDLPGDR
jgi:hypothetical protein